jgi:hypothetical protein
VIVLDAGRTFSGTTLDASESGLSLASPLRLQLGTHLKIDMAETVVLGYVCNCRPVSDGPFEFAAGVVIKYVVFGWKQFYDRVRSADNRVEVLQPRENTLFDELIAGGSSEELGPGLAELTPDARLAVLCTACFLVEEIAANCQERAANLGEIITANCRFYENGLRTCAQRFVDEPVHTIHSSVACTKREVGRNTFHDRAKTLF